MGDQICQFEHSNSSFILWKITSIQLVLESARLWYLKPGREDASTTRLRSPLFRSQPYGYNFYLKLDPYGFAAAIGTWASISLSMSAGEYDDFCLGRSQKQSTSKCVTSWTLITPGARQLRLKS